jgi:hypothetical protein
MNNKRKMKKKKKKGIDYSPINCDAPDPLLIVAPVILAASLRVK